MMSTLNREKIDELLQIKTPQEIRTQEMDLLDEEILRYLEEREENPGLEGLLRDRARFTREMLNQATERDLQEAFRPSGKYLLMEWIRGTTSVRNPVLAFALSLIIGGILVFIFPEKFGLSETKQVETIKRLHNAAGAASYDHTLFEALKKRGIYFFNVAAAGTWQGVGDPPDGWQQLYYEEAVTDLSQALEMNRDDDEVAGYLVRALNQLDKEQ